MEVNAAICYECLTVIQSRYRHDFQGCMCPNDGGIFVDGGLDYQRFGWGHNNYRIVTTNAGFVEIVAERIKLWNERYGLQEEK